MPSIQRHLAVSDHALLARTAGEREVEVTALLVSGGRFEVGSRIESTAKEALAPDQRWLVLFQPDRDQPLMLRVSQSAADFARAYARQAAARSDAQPTDAEPTVEQQAARLALFLDGFGNRDRMVESSVSDAFAAAPYEVVRALEPRLDPQQLGAWLENAPPEHRGILYLMLAIEGSDEARSRLRKALDDDTARSRAGYDGVLGAWLLMEGEAGLRTALARRPGPDAANGARVWYARCLLRALEFHLTSENVLPRDRVFETALGLFDDPYAAGPAIGMLIAQEHWESLEQVLTLRARWADERPSIDRATRAYLLACPLPRAKAVLKQLGDR